MNRALVRRLAEHGIATEYQDAFGATRRLDPDVAEQLLAAMGAGDGPPPDVDDAVLVTRPHRRDRVAPGELEYEDGAVHRVAGELPGGLPLGYHMLHRDDGATTSVIVSPGRCAPHPERVWGFSVQLYSVTSESSPGVGDLRDLRELGDWTRTCGAGLMLVNPLDAVVAERPRGTSPYFPSSRRFLDPLYVRVADIPGVSPERIPRELASPDAPGDDRRIDRDVVVETKRRALAWAWEHVPSAGHEEGFARFRDERGTALDRFATFEALSEAHGGGWRSWPARFHDPDAPAVSRFAAANAERIAFHSWVQWVLDEQLRTAAQTVPLMRDLPIGFDPDGADAWTWQDVVARDVTIGAPPDELGPAGQDWQLPAFVPFKLRAAAYRPFVETLRAAFRHAGALRIDHVLGLFRLFWVPHAGPSAGAYVRQDTEALLDIVALESRRAGAYVVGEDLGTVGPGVRDELLARGMLRYRVFWFEDDPPSDWGAQALGAVSTHDLPSVAAVWSGADVDLHRRLGLDVDEARLRTMRSDLAERARIPADAGDDDACVGAARMLASSGCDVVVVQLEDAVASRHRINVPGTDQVTRPENWSLKLECPREDLPGHPTVRRVVAAMRERRDAPGPTPTRGGPS